MANLYDESSRQIARGDVLRVFHFTDRRRKRHYMYKQARQTVMLGNPAKPFLVISHLDAEDDYYHESEDGRRMIGYEIVQSGSGNIDERDKWTELEIAEAKAVAEEMSAALNRK